MRRRRVTSSAVGHDGHPLDSALRALAEREPRFDQRPRPGQEYLPIGEMPIGDGQDGQVDGLRRRVHDLSLAYRLGLIAAPAIVALVTAHRLPDLSADNVLIRRQDERFAAFTLRSLAFACLPDDPDSSRHDATVAESTYELRARLHRSYTAGWLTKLVTAIAMASPLNEKALWGMVASGWAAGAGHAADIACDLRGAVWEVERLLDGNPRMGRVRPAFYEEPTLNGPRLRHWRAVCCLNYRLPQEVICEGECPLLPVGRDALRRNEAPR
jgi:hypothetical protein